MAPSSTSGNVTIVDIRRNNMKNDLAADIQRGLEAQSGKQRSLPTLLLYDTNGLRLFEDITYLDEYYLTQAEIDVLKANATEIVQRVPENAQLVELGSGNLRKVEILLNEFERTRKAVEYLALDLSLEELDRTFAELPSKSYDYVTCRGLWGTYADGLAWLGSPTNRQKPTWILSLGSSIGNFTRDEASEFLGTYAKTLGPSDSMLVGIDGCKDSQRVFSAYNDSKGVTREFYLNGLRHANNVLGYPAFREGEWDVTGIFHEDEGCHKAYYLPLRDVSINGVALKKGEKIFFEQSFKYAGKECEDLWNNAGLVERSRFGNGTGGYYLHLLSPAQLDLPAHPSSYAASPTPKLQDYEVLWRLWETVTVGMVPKDELLSKPIKLRNALVFYLGHIPVFLDIHLTRATGASPTVQHYASIFERGIDPDVDNPDLCHEHSEIPNEYPPVSEILQFQQDVRSRARSLLQNGSQEDRPLTEALWIGFEHEAMHLETFLYMLLQSEKALPPPHVAKPDFEEMARNAVHDAVQNEWFEIPEQVLAVGLDDPDPNAVPAESYGWDNEKPQRTVHVAPFSAKARPITNGEYAEYLEMNNIRGIPASWLAKESNGLATNGHGMSNGSQPNGGEHNGGEHDYSTGASAEFLEKYLVRTVFGPIPLQWALDWPVAASFDELQGYATWMECRLPSFEEVQGIYNHSATFKQRSGDATLPLANGNGEPNGVNKHSGKPRTPDHQPVQSSQQPTHQPVYIDLEGYNIGFKHWHPTPVTQKGNTLCGRGEMGGLWEWTSSPLLPHAGFKPMDLYPGYTADFFDGKHNIVLGGSWATHPRIAGRTTFVNWYQRNYPFVWAGARLVRDI